MGIVLAFAVGYFVGANAGQEGYRDVIDALHAVRDSDEFHALVAAVRSHASASFKQLSALIDDGDGEGPTPGRLLDRVRDLMDRGPAGSGSASDAG
jgi:hypothetical protein